MKKSCAYVIIYVVTLLHFVLLSIMKEIVLFLLKWVAGKSDVFFSEHSLSTRMHPVINCDSTGVIYPGLIHFLF